MEQIITLVKESISTDSQLLTSSEDLKPYLRGTEGLEHFDEKRRSALAVVKVADVSDIKAVVNLANQCAEQDSNFSIYPICSGRNWGYGTSQPASSANNIIILDLSALNKIELNEELGLVTVQPGVTQKQLNEYIEQRGDRYLVPVTGAGPECSILSNAVERGYGITPHQDHFAAVNSVKGIWGSGLEFSSALTDLDQSDEKIADKSFKWGLGPYLDGLFTQSNFGIVTEMTIRLAVRRSGFISFFVQIKDDAALEQIVPVVRQILADYEGVVGAINLMDKRRVMSMFADNPNGTDAHKIMEQKDVDIAAKKLDTPGWTVVGSLYGTQGVVKAAKKEIKKILKSLDCKAMFSDELLLKTGAAVMPKMPNFLFELNEKFRIAKEQVQSFQKGQEIMLGKPNKVALKLCYWRNPDLKKFDNPDNFSPGKDGCGLLWYAPLVPLTPTKVREFVDFIRATCPKHNIEPFITLTNFHHDSVDSTIPIVFDLNNKQAVVDAHNCLRELVQEGLKKGFVSYRLNVDQQQWLLDSQSNFWQATDKIKQALDPNRVISPGRYNPVG